MKIRGNTVGTTMKRANWTQTDETKSDYIKNKPETFAGAGVYVGTEEPTDPNYSVWVNPLGEDESNEVIGESAYEIAVRNGFEGTEEEWLVSLKGEQGVQGIQGEKGDTGAQGPQGVKGDKGDTGAQGIQGEKGEAFSVSKVYASVAEMNAGYASDNVSIGGFVVIETGNVDDEDNAKLFIKGNAAYEYLTDLSGAQGMQGPQGVQGVQGIQGEKGDTGAQGPQGEKGEKGDKGDKGETGATGSQGVQGEAGYTPVRGTDYWTESDKEEIVSSVLANFTDVSEVAL